MLNKIINGIRFIRKLDLGGFSSVWLAVHEVTHKQLAVKVFPKFLNNDDDITKRGTPNEEKSDLNDISQVEEDKSDENSNVHQIDSKKKSHFLAEINVLSKIDHPLILGYFGDFEDDENLYICMEYVPNGSLLDYINTHSTSGGIKEIVARRIFTELLVAIEYLHKQLKIFHRDLKCENVLIDSNNNIRLIDFGFSVMYQNSNDRFSEKIGSSGYTCPEMISNASYTPEKSDIWCLGIILFSMLVGKLPFDGNNDVETAEKIAFEEPEYPAFLSKNSVDLLKKILTKNPYRRIDIESIKRHPFLSQTELLIISRVNPTKHASLSLDQEIIFELSMNDKVDTTKLSKNNSDIKFSQEMLMYRQLKRIKDTKILQEVIEGKIISFDQKKKKKQCRFSFPDEEHIEEISNESDTEQSITTSISMPFGSYRSNIDSKLRLRYYKNSIVSNTDLRNQHDHSHIPLPDRKSSSERLSNLSQTNDDSFCDHYVEDTIIDDEDDDDYEQNSKSKSPTIPHLAKTKGGTSTPNFFSSKSQSGSENENESESSSRKKSSHKHKSKLKKSSKPSNNDAVAFPSTSYSVSSLSSLSSDRFNPNGSKKDLIRIAPRRRSKVSSKDPKSILSFIH